MEEITIVLIRDQPRLKVVRILQRASAASHSKGIGASLSVF